MRLIITEDTQAERDRLQHYTNRFGEERSIPIELHLFTDGKYLLDSYPEHPDILLLDIDMQYVSGIETARRIREFDTNVQILFITRMVQYALEGYEVEAADFIVKPVPYPIFAAKLDRVVRKIRTAQAVYLSVPIGKERCVLRSDQLICVEALNKRTVLHLSDGRLLETSQPLYALEKELEQAPFFRCHNAFLVNLSYVRSFSSTDAKLPDLTVPVSKYRKKDFLQALASYRGAML